MNYLKDVNRFYLTVLILFSLSTLSRVCSSNWYGWRYDWKARVIFTAGKAASNTKLKPTAAVDIFYNNCENSCALIGSKYCPWEYMDRKNWHKQCTGFRFVMCAFLNENKGLIPLLVVPHYCKKQIDSIFSWSILLWMIKNDATKCSKLGSETTSRGQVVPLEFWTFYDFIFIIHKSIDHEKNRVDFMESHNFLM